MAPARKTPWRFLTSAFHTERNRDALSHTGLYQLATGLPFFVNFADVELRSSSIPFLGLAKSKAASSNSTTSSVIEDAKHTHPKSSQRRLRILGGWRAGLALGLYACAIVLLINIVLLAIGAFAHDGYQSGIGTIAEGNSITVARIGTAHHVLVNILSTVLLTASNYCMQILCAPTRYELDMAHARGAWLDIGIISVHNLRYIGRRRAFSFVLLVLSSLPLHFFYNSAVFEVTIGQDYVVHYINSTDNNQTAVMNNEMQRLGNKDWIARYSTRYVSDTGNLFLGIDAVSLHLTLNSSQTIIAALPSNIPDNPWSIDKIGAFETSLSQHSLVTQGYTMNDLVSATLLMNGSLPWPQPHLVNVSAVSSIDQAFILEMDNTNCWVISNQTTRLPPLRVKSAWAKPTQNNSQVQVSLYFMLTVIVCNILKLSIIHQTLRASSIPRITTLGDAVSSFLERPDPAFAGMGLLDKNDVIRKLKDREGVPGTPQWHERSYKYYEWPVEQRGFSKGILTLLGCFSFILLVMAITIPKNKSSWGTRSTSSLWLAPQTFDSKGILMNAWMSNLPQVILSYSYFTINRICTSMCFTKEWNEYGTTRKGLRVSDPSGKQRNTYFLQLPYRWAVPLTTASGLLHWLASQSLFLSRLEIRDADGKLNPAESKCTTAFSGLSAAVFCGVFLVLCFVITALSLRKLKVHAPLALHCSMVVAATCHPPPEEANPHLEEVQWGVVRNRFGASIDHCTFTSEPVTLPEVEKAYA